MWRTQVLTEVLPLLFVVPFSIVSCVVILHYVDILLINTWMEYMNVWMDSLIYTVWQKMSLA